MKKQFLDLKVQESLITANDGQDVVEYFERYLSDIVIASDQPTVWLNHQPVALLLLDINMPILNGFETLKRVKEMFKLHNTRLNEERSRSIGDEEPLRMINTEEHTHILRPLIIFVSQLDRNQFTHFFVDDEKPDFYLEKPLVSKDLKSLLRLIKIL